MPMCERRTRWPGMLGPLRLRLQRRLTRLRCAEEGPCIQTLDPHYVSSMRITNTTRIKSSWIVSFWERFRQWLAGIVPVVHIFTAVIILVVIIVPVVHIFTAIIIVVIIVPCCPYLHCCHHTSGHHRPCCPYLYRYHRSGHHHSLLSISSLLSSY